MQPKDSLTNQPAISAATAQRETLLHKYNKLHVHTLTLHLVRDDSVHDHDRGITAWEPSTGPSTGACEVQIVFDNNIIEPHPH